jgi:hypothetical protein
MDKHTQKFLTNIALLAAIVTLALTGHYNGAGALVFILLISL